MSVDAPALPERSTIEPAPDVSGPELAYGYDDPDHPSELTIFLDVSDECLVTHWLTMDVQHTVSLDEMC